MLGHTLKRLMKSKILHVNEPYSAPQLRCVIFGASTSIAPSLTSDLGELEANIVFPVRTSAKWVDHLKPTQSYKNISFRQNLDFKDPNILDQVLEGANCVINLIGGYGYICDYEVLYESNVTMAKRIAEACARNNDIIRLLHISAVGVDPSSPSNRLQTKWLGEQEVKTAFPNATILRPTTIFGEFDNFVTRLGLTQSMFEYIPVVDNATELRQPIYHDDISTCIINALKMPEAAGKTYELGGPNVYSMREIIEIVYNKIGKPPAVRSISYRKAHTLMQYLPHLWGFTRHMSLNDVQESKVNLVVAKDALSCADLYVKPVSFSQNLIRMLQDNQVKVDLTNDDIIHGWYGGGDDRHYEP